MKKILKQIRALLYTEYRLTVYVDGNPQHTYSVNRQTLLQKTKYLPDGTLWVLYKRGPFRIHEHQVAFGTNSKKKE